MAENTTETVAATPAAETASGKWGVWHYVGAVGAVVVIAAGAAIGMRLLGGEKTAAVAETAANLL